MPHFSERSLKHLNTCDERLRRVMHRVVEEFDCAIIDGHREEKTQNDYHRSGVSQLNWPDSKHNEVPSRAVDVVPYPVDWHDREQMSFFAGYVLGMARSMGINIRWGGDWNKNWRVSDNKFDDLVHFELED